MPQAGPLVGHGSLLCGKGLAQGCCSISYSLLASVKHCRHAKKTVDHAGVTRTCCGYASGLETCAIGFTFITQRVEFSRNDQSGWYALQISSDQRGSIGIGGIGRML